MRNVLFPLLVLAVFLPAVASEPGQPIDCSDWVIVKPGITCRDIPIPTPAPWYSRPGANPADNENFLIGIVSVRGFPLDCGFGPIEQRYELRRFNGVNDELVAYVQARCGPSGSAADTPNVEGIFGFTYNNGFLYVVGTDECWGDGVSCAYTAQSWLIRFEGFTTELDVLQTFTSQARQVGFHVPVMPEGMAAADHFDTYWGDLSAVGNWSQAHGLQCHYPDSPPTRGDYLTVADTLPTPQPGHGYYYVTAATYQGQTRYGRKTTNRTLSGRDPAQLPACSPLR